MTEPDTVEPFDVCGPLPDGVTVLEASAGTGKTYTIAALAARYVADGVPLERLLLVTFTRLATGELRERVRRRLVETEQGLASVLAGGPAGDDEVTRLLATGARPEVALRHRRLAAALAGFDAATIATTHGFCSEVLAGLGVAGDAERDLRFVEEVDDLVEEVVDDLYVRKWHAAPGAPQFDRRQALLIARAAVQHPDAVLAPADAPVTTLEGLRVSFATRVLEELEARKRRLGILTYDDLLTRLQETLAGPGGPTAAARLRERFAIVLVDEFQDTDPIQWEILRHAFIAPGTTLVLIGDPKQAIYAFRGADVYAYLRAARTAGAEHTLSTNQRSDQGLIDAHDAVFGAAQLGHPGIVYRPVRATAAHVAPRLAGAPVGAPLRIRVVSRAEPRVGLTPSGLARAPGAARHVELDLAQDVVRLLASGATIEERDAAGAGPVTRRVCPGDIAVLVRTHRTAAGVRGALADAGVPAVLSGAGSVFATDAAADWLRLLRALERPTSALRARTVALTPFLGWTTARVAAAPETEWDGVHRRLHRWARLLRRDGVAVLAETLMLEESIPGRVLAVTGGERTLTDIRHIGQLLHEAAVRDHLGTTALAGWLRERIRAAAQEGDEERARRLESDDEAVQIFTIHGAKGLEWPIVYLPDLYRPTYLREKDPLAFHDPDAADARTLDVGLGTSAHRDRSERLHRAEQRGEDLRLLYVALTRARHQVVVWWAGTYDSHHSALGRLLFARGEDGSVAPTGQRVASDDAAIARFRTVAAAAEGCVTVEAAALSGLPASWSGEIRTPPGLAAASVGRPIDTGWRRTSFSDLTAGAHEARVASEPERPVLADEPAGVVPAPVATDDVGSRELGLRDHPSLWDTIPGGVGVGTLVHEVLEHVDFRSPTLEDDVRTLVADAVRRRPLDVGDPEVLVAGVLAAVETPLGPHLGDARLRDVAAADRLDELAFELPVAGGDEHDGASLTPGVIARVLRDHVPAGDPLARYADHLAEDEGLRRSVHGYLAGFIDLVLRVPGPGPGRFWVVDHKTNRLGGHDLELTAWHYRPEALAAEMQRSHYVLQGLLYGVALHRYLRWRLPDEDPGAAFGGIAYLFLRGMAGPGTPRVDGVPCGVFTWRPPSGLIAELSDALHRGRS